MNNNKLIGGALALNFPPYRREHAHDINPDLYYYANPSYLALIQILK